jgi:hypothetical protein
MDAGGDDEGRVGGGSLRKVAELKDPLVLMAEFKLRGNFPYY